MILSPLSPLVPLQQRFDSLRRTSFAEKDVLLNHLNRNTKMFFNTMETILSTKMMHTLVQENHQQDKRYPFSQQLQSQRTFLA